MVTLQNVLARSKKQEAQNVDRVQAPAEGQAGATRRCRWVGWGAGLLGLRVMQRSLSCHGPKRPRLSESQRQVLICLGLFQGWQKPLQVI